jgi:hypothetical protein
MRNHRVELMPRKMKLTFARCFLAVLAHSEKLLIIVFIRLGSFNVGF